MRRLIAISLLVITGFISAMPVLGAEVEAKVPACCRRAGKHHCMNQTVHGTHDGPAFAAVRMKCPMFPRGAVVARYSAQLLPVAAQSFYAALFSHPAEHAQIEVFYRICWSRTQQKRGPPALLS